MGGSESQNRTKSDCTLKTSDIIYVHSLRVNFYHTCCKNAKQHVPYLANTTHSSPRSGFIEEIPNNGHWQCTMGIFNKYRTLYLFFPSKKTKCLGIVYYLQIKEIFQTLRFINRNLINIRWIGSGEKFVLFFVSFNPDPLCTTLVHFNGRKVGHLVILYLYEILMIL